MADKSAATRASASLGPNFTARPTLKIDTAALKDNYKAIQKIVGNAQVAACVKADGYGLGAERVGRALYGAGCRNYFVATAGEGKALREAVGPNCSIYVLNGPAPRDLTLFFGSDLKPVINSLVQARIWAEAIENVKHVPFSVLHFDTGMNRLGLTAEETELLSKNRGLRDKLQIEMVMSHLACAPEANHPLNTEQLSRFKAASARFPVMPMSLCNSAGVYLGKKYHFQMVRPGIALYGGKATDNPEQEKSQPVVSLMAPVLQVKDIRQGDTLGYDATYTAPRDMTIATIGAGYADGIPVAVSSAENTPRAHFTLSGQRASVVGRVSMDLTILDVTDQKKKPRIGDWAEYLGETLEEDAQSAGTINYELLVRFSQRAARQFR